MNITELLTEIEKLPGEWRHPGVDELLEALDGRNPAFVIAIILDLHLRHIAERLAHLEIGVWPDFDARNWWVEDHETSGRELSKPTYAEALVAAAREVASA